MKYCINIHIMSLHVALNACRACGATNYRRVIARDGAGDLKPTGLYQCSGCSVVFANPKAWRDGGVDELDVLPRRATNNAATVPPNRPDLA